MSNQVPNHSQYVYDSNRAVPAQPNSSAPKSRIGSKVYLAIAASAVAGSIIGGGAVVTAGQFFGGGQTVIVNNAHKVNWVTAVAKRAEPSVVTISVSESGGNAGSGSGIVLTADGYILTNTHVVTLDGATAAPRIDVKTSDGRVYSATVVGTDPTNDLAVIRVRTAGKLTPATFADSTKLNVGDNVVAIGAPLGLDATVTSGIISALDRTIQVANSAAPQNGGLGGLQLFQGGSSSSAINLSVIQTDAAINPGNSGGALLNDRGDVIGVNVAIASAGSTGGQSGNIGVGFSIPSNNAQRVANEIIKTGKASHAMLGAYITDKSSGGSAGFSVGATISKLMPNSPAEKAGIKVGDVVTSFNGQPVTSASDLTADVRLQPAGAKVTLEVIRDGAKINIDVVLGDAANLK